MASRPMTIMYVDVCANCGENIHMRNRNQGWLHGTEERRCRPTHAKPREGKYTV